MCPRLSVIGSESRGMEIIFSGYQFSDYFQFDAQNGNAISYKELSRVFLARLIYFEKFFCIWSLYGVWSALPPPVVQIEKIEGIWMLKILLVIVSRMILTTTQNI